MQECRDECSLQCRRFLRGRKCFCSRKGHVETSRREEEMGRVKGSGKGVGREKRKPSFPSFLLSPSHPLAPTLREPLGLLFLLSPIFHCHEIKDGGYNNPNTTKVSPTQNTPALQAKIKVKSTTTRQRIQLSNRIIINRILRVRLTWFDCNLFFSFFKPINFNSLFNCVKSATSLNSFKNMMIKYFTGL